MSPELEDVARARAAVFDPATPAGDLADIARRFPGLRGVIAEHPRADESLRAWLAGLGAPDPAEVAAALPVPPASAVSLAPPGGTAAEPGRTPRRWVVPVVILVVLALVAAGAAAYRFVIWPAWHIAPWAKTFGGAQADELKAVAVAPDGTIVVAGMARSTEGELAAAGVTRFGGFIAKLTPHGDLVWARQRPGPDLYQFLAVAVAPDGSIVAAGMDEPQTPDGDTMGVAMGVVAKLSASGDVLWTCPVPDPDHQVAYVAVALAPGGDIVAAGQAGPPPGQTDSATAVGPDQAVLARVHPDGTLAWMKTYGGTSAEFFTSVAVAPSGDLVAVGTSISAEDYVPGRYDSTTFQAVLARITSDGTLWSSTGLDGVQGGIFSTVAVSPDNSITAAGSGSIRSTAGGDGAVVAHWDPDATLAWTVFPDVSGGPAGLAATADGGLVLVGQAVGPVAATGSDGFVARLNNDGTTAWVKVYGGEANDTFNAVAIARDGDILAVGSTDSLTGTLPPTHGDLDAVAVRLSPDGTLGPA